MTCSECGRWWWALVALFWATTALADTGAPVTLREAIATLTPAGGSTVTGTVTLPHQWDKAYPGRDGTTRYELALPSIGSEGPRGLYFPRVGNQVEVRVDGHLLYRGGILGNPSTDIAKQPVWVSIPAGLAASHLSVTVSTQGQRWGGLAPLVYGPAAPVWSQYRARYVWRQYGALAATVAMGLMAIAAAGLWTVQREEIYGLFVGAAAFGALRFADRLWPEPPLPWPLWGAVTAVALAWHVVLMTRFALLVIQVDSPALRRAFWGAMALEAVLATLAFITGHGTLWTVALGLLTLPNWGAFVLVIRQVRRRPDRQSVGLLLASFVVLVAGFRDFVAVRLSGDGPGTFSILPHASVLFVLLLGWVVIERYRQSVRDHQALLQTLDARVRQREQELEASNARLREEHGRQAALVERQRIMRDIHDGVGAQLVGLISLMDHDGATRATLQDQVRLALDELRMAVDALQPVHDDLLTVLGTLRYRMQPRLEAAGIRVEWGMDPLPPLQGLTPQVVLQLQRILLEAFTNVIRHARATRLTVRTRWLAPPGPGLVLLVEDDGCGFDATRPTVTQGLASMRARAAGLGARLSIASAPRQGTRLTLSLPLPLQATSPGEWAGKTP